MSDETIPASSSKLARIMQALELIDSGKSLSEAGQQMGVTAQAISQFLLSNVPEEYKPPQERGLTARLVQQAENLENASNHIEVSRARETARFWCWVSERLLPRFASKQEISGPGGGPIQLEDKDMARRLAFVQQMMKRAPAVIDVDPIVSTAASS